MRLYEVITENVSRESSIKIIVDILTTELPNIYRSLSRLAENYFNNHGELGKGYRFIAGGAKSKWYNDVFFNQLKPALYNLSKTLPSTSRNELNRFLSSIINDGSFNRIETELIPLLSVISNSVKDQKLIAATRSDKHTIERYNAFLIKLEADEDEPTVSKVPNQPNAIAQQNASADSIINHTLSRIDQRQAGEIRNILARSDNKLSLLQQELNKRGIRL